MAGIQQVSFTSPYSAEEADIEKGKEGKPQHGAEPDDDVRAACVASCAHDFVSEFPDGYDTDVGEGSIQGSHHRDDRSLSRCTHALDYTTSRLAGDLGDARENRT